MGVRCGRAQPGPEQQQSLWQRWSYHRNTNHQRLRLSTDGTCTKSTGPLPRATRLHTAVPELRHGLFEVVTYEGPLEFAQYHPLNDRSLVASGSGGKLVRFEISGPGAHFNVDGSFGAVETAPDMGKRLPLPTLRRKPSQTPIHKTGQAYLGTHPGSHDHFRFPSTPHDQSLRRLLAQSDSRAGGAHRPRPGPLGRLGQGLLQRSPQAPLLSLLFDQPPPAFLVFEAVSDLPSSFPDKRWVRTSRSAIGCRRQSVGAPFVLRRPVLRQHRAAAHGI